MSRLRDFWRVEATTFVVLFLCLMAIGPTSLLRDPGTLWHIRVGELILDSGAMVRTDPFSATFGGQTWVPMGWLAECVVALLHRIGGLDTVLLAAAALLATLYAILAKRLSARGIQAPIVALLVVLCVAASSYHFHPRPHLATMLALAWMFARLGDFEAGRVTVTRLWWMVPIVIAWTNMHGGVVGGLATFALCGAGWTVTALAGGSSPLRTPADFGKLLLLGVVCLLATLVNPYGIDLPKIWFTLLDSPVLPQLMNEHGPLQLSESSGRIVVALGLLYGAALLGVPWRSVRVTWLIPLVWFALSLSRIRNGPLFAITATLALGEMYAQVRWIGWLTDHGSELLSLRSPEERRSHERCEPRAAVIPALLVAVALALEIARIPLPVLGHGWARLDPAYWPVDLLPELQAHERAHPEGAPILNDMLFGGFLIYSTPGLHVFIDDRCEVYGDVRLDEYRRAIQGETSLFDEWTRQYGFEIALSQRGSTLETYLRDSPAWELVRKTEPASLYRKSPGNCAAAGGRGGFWKPLPVQSSAATSRSSRRRSSSSSVE